MTTVDIIEAATQLPRLIERAQAGEEIAIARDGQPVARLLPVPEVAPAELPLKRRLGGQLEGKMWISPDFDDPLPEEILATVPASEASQKRRVSGQLRDDPWLSSIDLDAPLDEEVARSFGMLDG